MQYALIFFGTLFLLRLLARLAVRVGLVDYPGRRKRHRGEVPLIGGPAIFAGLAFGVLFTTDTLYPYRPLFAALAILLIAGLLDDLRDLTPTQKFMAQLVAGGIMVWWGHHTVVSLGDLLGIDSISTDYWAIPFTLIALLGLINAINMVDGADGLASGLALIALVFLAVSAVLTGRTVSAPLLFTIVAVVLAFWATNMRFPWQPHAKVFLGDSGSMILGALLTWFSIELARGRGGIYPITAVWFLALPLIDMGVVIARRLARGHSPFRAGRDHLHHMLIAAGMSPGAAVLLVLFLGLALAATGFFAWRAGVPEYWLFFGFVALLVLSSVLSWRWPRLARRFRRRQRSAGRSYSNTSPASQRLRQSS
jgi:UDP-GlcNAc:undecaprenyl-phosphate GlcNAc-1-phosphate transferase